MRIFQICNIQKYIDISIENPFKTWWKARKYFKRPKLKFHIYWKDKGVTKYEENFHYYNWGGKILDINIHDVWWKDKYNSPRHEFDPIIYIGLFKLINFSITFHINFRNEFNEKEDGNLEYWEYLLDYLYYSKNLLNYGGWHTNSKLYKYWKGKEKRSAYFYIPTVAMSLNKQGIKQLKKELNEKI